MNLLPTLPEPYRTRMRDAVIPRVLKHLTLKRPVAVDRTEFFAHAEAFAALVQLECVSIPGAAPAPAPARADAPTRAAPAQPPSSLSCTGPRAVLL